jgi:acyl-CoA synthetase (AMP-forming)/AMP-acid ligase II
MMIAMDISKQLLHHYFEYQARLRPQHIALNCQGVTLTYQQLDARANQVAHWLYQQGYTCQKVVAIVLELSIEFYIIHLAILKAGAVYLALDPYDPPRCLKAMIEHSQASIVLTLQKYQDDLPDLPCPIAAIDRYQLAITKAPNTALDIDTQPQHLCYLLYSTTIDPMLNAVAIEHQHVCAYLQMMTNTFMIKAEDRIYQGLKPVLGWALSEIWLAFANGATLIVNTPQRDVAPLPDRDFLITHKVSVLITFTAHLRQIQSLNDIRLVFLIDNQYAPWHARRKELGKLNIIHLYGYCETTMIAGAFHYLPEQGIVTIKAFCNNELLILNEKKRPVSAEEEGDLYISSPTIARGYYHNSALTCQKFTSHPHHAKLRIFKTGDRACMTKAGQVKITTQNPLQIKWYGVAITIAEMESLVMNYSGIWQATIVVSHLQHALPQLVAFMVLKPGTDVVQEMLERYLRDYLPHYMIPTLYLCLESMPIMTNGKINRQALAKLADDMSQTNMTLS